MRKLRPHEFAKELNVSAETLKRWDRTGYLPAKRTPSNRRYYTDSCKEAYLKDVNASKVIEELSRLTEVVHDLQNGATDLDQDQYFDPSSILSLITEANFIKQFQNACKKSPICNKNTFPLLYELVLLYLSDKLAYKKIIAVVISKLQKYAENELEHKRNKLIFYLSRDHRNIPPSLLIQLNDAYSSYTDIIGLYGSNLSEALYSFDEQKCIDFINLQTRIDKDICAEFVKGEKVYRMALTDL